MRGGDGNRVGKIRRYSYRWRGRKGCCGKKDERMKGGELGGGATQKKSIPTLKFPKST